MIKQTPLIHENLLKLLVCPVTGGELVLKDGKLLSNIGNLSYKIEDGIPIMIPENPNSENSEK